MAEGRVVLPPYKIKWRHGEIDQLRGDQARLLLDEKEALWERRSVILAPYRREVRKSKLGLSENTLLWANVLYAANVGWLEWIEGPRLLPESLAREISEWREQLMGAGSRPLTAEALEADPEELAVARKWAVGAIQDGEIARRLGLWFPEAVELAPREPNRAVALLCASAWPVGVRLKAQAVATLYTELVSPLEPDFVPFATYLTRESIRASEMAVSRLFDRWWRAYQRRAKLSFPNARTEFRIARQRVGRRGAREPDRG